MTRRLRIALWLSPLAALLLLAWMPAPAPRQYLVVWAMQAGNPHAHFPTRPASPSSLAPGRDILAVFDISAQSFGKLVAMLPAGPARTAHHTNYSLPPDDVLYANDWLGNDTRIFDLRDPLHPRQLRQVSNAGTYGYPHSFQYLPNGHTLATFQFSGGFDHAPGGLVEFDHDGRVVQSSSAAAPNVDPNIRPYSLAVIPALDRVVTGSAAMMSGGQPSHVVQVWRLSDLKLLQTLPLPQPFYPYVDAPANASEPRLLADGQTAAVTTSRCGLFLVRGLASARASLEHVYDFGYRACDVPEVAGHYYLQATMSGHAVVSLDMRDPEHPREVGRALLPAGDYPHWISVDPNGDRVAITGFGGLLTQVRFATLDPGSGALHLDPRTLDFTRAWPDGWRGSAIPHAAVFWHP
jgi:hypothetical protein